MNTPHGRLANAAARFNESNTGYTASVTLVSTPTQGH